MTDDSSRDFDPWTDAVRALDEFRIAELLSRRYDPDAVLDHLQLGCGEHWRNATAIVYASFHGAIRIVDHLLRYGADTDAATIHGITALMNAASRMHWEIAELLISQGADRSQRSSQRMTPLHYGLQGLKSAISRRNRMREAPGTPSATDVARLARLMPEGSALRDLEDGIATPALHVAASSGWTAVIAMLINSGADPKRRDAFFRTAGDCARFGAADFVDSTLPRGRLTEDERCAKSICGQLQLQYGPMEFDSARLRILGALARSDPTFPPEAIEGWPFGTLLHAAVITGQEIVQVARIVAGIDVRLLDTPDLHGKPAFVLAVETLRFREAGELLTLGADVDSPAPCGVPREIALAQLTRYHNTAEGGIGHLAELARVVRGSRELGDEVQQALEDLLERERTPSPEQLRGRQALRSDAEALRRQLTGAPDPPGP